MANLWAAKELDDAAGVIQKRIRNRSDGRKPQWPIKLILMQARIQRFGTWVDAQGMHACTHSDPEGVHEGK